MRTAINILRKIFVEPIIFVHYQKILSDIIRIESSSKSTTSRSSITGCDSDACIILGELDSQEDMKGSMKNQDDESNEIKN